MRIVYRLPLFLLIIATYLVHLGWTAPRFIRDKKKLRALRVRGLQQYSSLILKLLGIQVRLITPPSAQAPDFQRASLKVSNHMSYLDVLILSSVYPSIFVTSVEVQKTPFLGDLSAAGGSLFVERRNRSTVQRDQQAMAEVLRSGTSITLFPEGTSTNGSGVLPFKHSLFESALLSQVPVQPICLRYSKIDGQNAADHQRDWVCYHGDLVFFPHLLRLMSLKGAEAEVEILTPINITPDTERKDVAIAAFDQITQAYRKSSLYTESPNTGELHATSILS